MPELGILKTCKGLVQLYRCPTCRFLVSWEDVVWARKPRELGDAGEIKCCSFCAKGEPDMIRDVVAPIVREESMQTQVRFRFYMNLGDKAYAVFSDPQGGPDFILSRKDCEERLKNLKDNSWSVEETEKALRGWP